MENTITYVAMDTHKKQHKVALHYPCQGEKLSSAMKPAYADLLSSDGSSSSIVAA